MAKYSELWRNIETRLTAASRLMRVDAPAAAEKVSSAFQDWLAHNELELALDQLLDGVPENGPSLRRRFWEEVLTAAMLMRLEYQFLEIADHIPDLEPHTFVGRPGPPRIWCDFNGLIEESIYSLDAVGTALDMARLCLVPEPGQHVILYDTDAEEDGAPTWLLADAQIVDHPPWGLVAKTHPASFRREGR